MGVDVTWRAGEAQVTMRPRSIGPVRAEVRDRCPQATVFKSEDRRVQPMYEHRMQTSHVFRREAAGVARHAGHPEASKLRRMGQPAAPVPRDLQVHAVRQVVINGVRRLHHQQATMPQLRRHLHHKKTTRSVRIAVREHAMPGRSEHPHRLRLSRMTSSHGAQVRAADGHKSTFLFPSRTRRP